MRRADAAVKLLAIIVGGAPHGMRSEMFAKVVWALAAAGYSLDEIQGKLAAHPDGIASKYAGRLEKETARCFAKWQIRNPKGHLGRAGVARPDRGRRAEAHLSECAGGNHGAGCRLLLR